MFLVWTASPPRRTPRLVFHITVTPMLISNSYLTWPYYDPQWKNSIDFGENRKTTMVDGGHFVKNMMKKLVHYLKCTHQLHIKNI